MARLLYANFKIILIFIEQSLSPHNMYVVCIDYFGSLDILFFLTFHVAMRPELYEVRIKASKHLAF